MKKILKIIMLCVLLVCFTKINVLAAPEKTVIHYIFDKVEVNKNDEFTLTLLLEKYQDLSTVQFGCLIDPEVCVPVIKNNQYFVKPMLSLFEDNEIYENSYFAEEKLLRFVGITKGGKSYGYSGLNQVFNVTFKANKDIQNVKEYFQTNSSTILIDKWAKDIEKEVRYSENLKAVWNKKQYEVDVYSSLPNIKIDIQVLNRNASEYQIDIIEDELDLSKVGSQVVKIKIYDYLTTQVIYLAKSVNVVDRVTPVVEIYKEEVIIEDVNIDNDSFEYFIVSDNYDASPKVFYKYFTANKQEISSLKEFKKYLKNNLQGIVSCYAVDSSNNQSKEVMVNIKVNDTTAPVINELTDIVVEDTKIDNFTFESLIQTSDAYDKNPQVICEVYSLNGQKYENYIQALNEVYDIRIDYYAVDASGNRTTTKSVKVTLKDTTPPVLQNVLDKVIPDEDLKYYLVNYDLLIKDFIITDNFKKELTLNKVYYYQEEIITEESFFNNLKKGLEGVIAYNVIDSYGNSSSVLYQKVKVIDDTAPSVEINNVENNGKYLGPVKVDYLVSDNLDAEVDVKVLLNGESYQGTEILDLGTYSFIVEATDIFGNKTTKEITFEIVEENIFGCIDGINCAENNYAVGIIIGIVIVLLVGLVVTFEVFYIKKKKNQPQE